MTKGSAVRAATAATVLCLAAAPALAADPAAGEAIARGLCAACHDVGPGGAAKGHPPSFAAIAGYRPEEQIRRRVLFPDSHSGMPDLAFSTLESAEVDDVVAYILSLE